MRRFAALLFILALTLSARAEDWTTADGKVYRNVVVVSQDSDGVRITYTGGVGIIPYYELSDDLLRRFGQDPASLAVKREAAQKAAADAALKAQQDAVEQKKEQDDAAAAQAAQQAMNPSPSPAPTSSPAPTPPKPVVVAPPESAPPAPGPSPAAAANQAPSENPAPVFTAAALPTQDDPYPHSKFQYSENDDMCSLSSFTVNVVPISLDASASAPSLQSQGGTFYLSIATEGHRAEAPDTVSGVFISSVPLKKLAENQKVKFLVDGAYIQGTPTPVDSDTAPPDAALQSIQVLFVLNPEEMKSLATAKNINFSVGPYDYRVDDAGVAILRGYETDVLELPPPSTNLVRSYHRLINKLPSIVTMISTTCEYIIFSAFGIVVVAAIAAFIMGLTRFIKM